MCREGRDIREKKNRGRKSRNSPALIETSSGQERKKNKLRRSYRKFAKNFRLASIIFFIIQLFQPLMRVCDC